MIVASSRKKKSEIVFQMKYMQTSQLNTRICYTKSQLICSQVNKVNQNAEWRNKMV